MAQHYDKKHAELMFLIYHDPNRPLPVLSHRNRTFNSGICLEHEACDNGGVYGARATEAGPVFVGFDGLVGLEVECRQVGRAIGG